MPEVCPPFAYKNPQTPQRHPPLLAFPPTPYSFPPSILPFTFNSASRVRIPHHKGSRVDRFREGRSVRRNPSRVSFVAGSPCWEDLKNMDNKETGFETPEAPILCINNCGFFGSAATMNMCSKCHKDMVMKQEQAKLAAASIDSIMNGSGSSSGKEPVVSDKLESGAVAEKAKAASPQPSADSLQSDARPREGPNRCSTCRKRVGLTGFTCRCGNLFCGVHRYSEKHNCPFDYRTAARDAIAKANPVIKSEKLEKI